MSIDFDIDDIFGDLDDIEESIEELNSETIFDRHDRLKQASLDADRASEQAGEEVGATAFRLSRSVGISPERRNGKFWASVLVWPREVWEWSTQSTVIEITRKGGKLWPFADNVSDDVREEITAVLAKDKAAHDLAVAARQSWQAARPQFTDPEADNFSHLIEGCYVSFEDRGASFNYTGYGEVVQITATNYVVKIDHDAISKRGSRSDRLHFAEKQTSMLKTATCFKHAGYAGGRSVQLLWGPVGNSKRAEVDAAERKAQQAEQQRQRDAVARRDAAQLAYRAARSADAAHRAALAGVQAQAEQAALAVIKAKYAKEFAALTKAMAAGIEESLSEYQRPDILDNPPSSDWQHYIEEES